MLPFVQAARRVYTKSHYKEMQIIPVAAVTDYLSIGNLLAILALIFAAGRLAERVSQHEKEIKDCKDDKIQNAVLTAKLEAFKEALERSNKLLERYLYDERKHNRID